MSRLKNPFKKTNDSGDIPYYVDESIIKDYERSVEMSKEILKNEELQIETAKKIKALKSNPTQEQSDIDDLRIRMYQSNHLETTHDVIATGMHIQSLKAIVALEKIMRLTIKKLPQEQSKDLLSIIQEIINQRITDEDKDILRWIRDYMKRAKTDDTNP